MRNVIFHTIKAKAGWCNATPRLDVDRIINMELYRRVFCIFDRDLPYKLIITYYDPELETTPRLYSDCNYTHTNIPVYTNNSIQHVFSFRYPTIEKAQEDMKQIQHKQLILRQIKEEFTREEFKFDYSGKNQEYRIFPKHNSELSTAE